MPYLKINGQTKQFADGELPSTVAELLGRLSVDSTTVVAELDGQIIERAENSQPPIFAMVRVSNSSDSCPGG